MPWSPSDAKRHSKKANSPAKRAAWSSVANQVLRKTGDEARGRGLSIVAIDEAGGD